MKKLFAWNTLGDDGIIYDVRYTYGDKIGAKDLKDWNNKYFDLQVKADLKLAQHLSYNFLEPNEKAYWLLAWRGDGKMTGASETKPYEPNSIQILNLTIEKGNLFSEFELEAFLIVRKNNWENDERPDGSILAQKTIFKNSNFSENGFFPIREFQGDGKKMFYWQYKNTDDLSVSVQSGICIHVDLTHPFLRDLSSNEEIKKLLLLMIIQDYFQKALSIEVFDNLLSNKKTAWPYGSIGRSLYSVLDAVKGHLKITTYQTLKERYYTRPEEVSGAINELYSTSLKNIR